MVAGGLAKTRADIIHGQGFTEVRFRRPSRWFSLIKLVLFGGIWLFGCAFALLLATGDSEGFPWFATIWLTIWGLGGLLVLGLLVWSMLGTESLTIRSDGITLVHRLLLLEFPTVVPAAELGDIRWFPDDPQRSVTVNGRRIPQTGIEVGSATSRLRFARGIGEADAQSVIAAIGQRLVISRRRQ